MANIKTDPSSIFAMWKKDVNYKNKMGFTKKWAEYVRFKEGNQWDDGVRRKWKNFSFLTINQCDFVVENKKSNILSQSIKLLFKLKEVPTTPQPPKADPNAPPEQQQQMQVEQQQIEAEADEKQKELLDKADDYTNLADNTWKDVEQNQLNNDAVDDCLTTGNGVFYYYFDDSYKGGQYVKTKGRICGHTINALDMALGNPQLKAHELQKQPYIILKTYEDTDEVKEKAKKNGKDYLLITSDTDSDEQYDSGKIDLERPNKTKCLTMFYKEGNAVYWTKVTQSAIVQLPRPLSPSRDKNFTIYPIEHLVFKPRTKCAYGRGVIEDIISIQKGINFLYSMIAYGVQQTAWPKILAKVNSLIQPITNEPGEIIIDHNMSVQGDAIKYMQPPNFSNMPPLLIDKLTESLRQTTGATEVVTGEVIGANMAASAIIALQNQAKKPNEAYVKQLYASMKRVGRIYEEFFKCYYILPRSVTSKGENNTLKSKTFTPSDYKDMVFDMDINAGPSGEFSEALQLSMLDQFAQRGWTNKWEYAKYAPDNMIPQEMKEDYSKQYEKIQPMLMQQMSAFLWKDMPRIVINYSDLPQDAQVQALDQMGIKSQGGLSNKLSVQQQTDQSKIQASTQPTPDQQLKLQQMFSQAKVNLTQQEIQRIMQDPQFAQLLNQQLSTDQAQHLTQNPDILNQVQQQQMQQPQPPQR